MSTNTVGRLLKAMDFRFRVNHKKNEANANVDPAERDRQFQTIKRQRICFENQGLPVISVEAKAKELVGNFKNDGKAYCREPENVDIYDFPSEPSVLTGQGFRFEVGKRIAFISERRQPSKVCQ